MDSVQFHYPAVIAAALACFAIGGLWYSPILFGRAWMRETGVTDEKQRQSSMGRIFGLAALANAVMAFNLAAFIGAKASVGFGLAAGFATGFGWVAMSMGVNDLFERRSLRLWLINAGYNVVAYTVMGGILGAWK